MLRGFGRPTAPSVAPPPPFATQGGSASSSSSSAVAKAKAQDSYSTSRSAPSLGRPGTLGIPSGLGALPPSAEVSPVGSARGPRASDLDFSVLCSHVLVMQRPWKLPTNLDIPRNNVGDVAEFLNGTFDRRYQIFSIDGKVSGHTASRAESMNGFADFRDQALLFRSSDSHHVKQPPPPLSLLCSFCSSVLFWLNLDRSRNVCVLQIGEHASAAVLLFFATLLLALEMVPPSRAELLRHLEAVCRADGPPRKKASTLRWIDHTSWAPSLRRYLGYVESLCKHGRRLKYVKPPRLCVMLVDVKRFARGSDHSDIRVEVYTGAYNEETVTTELRLVVDESSYQVMHSAPDDGALLLEMSPDGRAPLWVQGDVAVVVKLASRPHVCCRYFFHTDFVIPGESDYLLLTKPDLDIDRDAAELIPEDVMVGIALSDRAPNAGTEQPLQDTMPQVLALPNARPVGDKLEFTRYHVVAPEACLLKELVEGGFAKADVVVALQVTRNSFVDSIDFLSRYFPMSSQAGASRLASWALFAQPQAGQSPPDSEPALSESTTDITTKEAEVTFPTTVATSAVQVAVKVPEPQRVEKPSRSFWPWSARKQAAVAPPAATATERITPRPAQPIDARRATSSRSSPPPLHIAQPAASIVTGAPAALPEAQPVQPQQIEARAAQISSMADRMTVHDAQLTLPKPALKSLPKARGASRKSRQQRPMSSRTSGKVDSSVQQLFAKGGGPLGGPWPSPMPAPPAVLEDTAGGSSSVDGAMPLTGCLDTREANASSTPAIPTGVNSPHGSGAQAAVGDRGTTSSAGADQRQAHLNSGGSASEMDANADAPQPSTPSNTAQSTTLEESIEAAPAPSTGPPPKAAKAKGRGKGPPAAPPKSSGAGATATGPAANCSEEPEGEPPNDETGAQKEGEATTQAKATAKVAPPVSGKGKVGPPPKGKGKGGPPPPPGAKAAAGPPAPASEGASAAPGKAGPPPPKGKGVAPKGAPKGKAKAGFAAKAKSGLAGGAAGTVQPLGRKFHWKPIPERNLENTVWEEINAEDVGSDPTLAKVAPSASPGARVGLRPEVLERLFKNGAKDTTSAKAKAGARRKTEPDKITILDNKRAQNVGIILCGLGFDPTELCDRLKTLNTESLSIDSLEKCRDILPTEDEVERLVAYRGEISALRVIEKRLHPLAFMSRLVQRLKLMTFNMQLPHLASDLESDIGKLVQATKQVRESKQLKKILRVVLILGNFVNYGTTDEKAKPTKGFSVEALPKLSEMKSPVHSSINMLHYVAYRILGPPDVTPGARQAGGSTDEGADQRELRLLKEELSLVGEASRVAPNNVQKQLEALGQETNTVTQELKFNTKYEPEALEAMRKLQIRAEARLDELTAAFSECERQSQDLLHFFGEDPRHRSVNALMGTLQEFIDAFAGAAGDLRKQPKKFELLLQPTPPLASDGSAEGTSSAAAAAASVSAGRRFTVAGANSSLAAAAAVAAGSDDGSVLKERGEVMPGQAPVEERPELPMQARRTCPPGQLLADLDCLYSADLDKVSETKTCPSPTGEADAKNVAGSSSANGGKASKGKGKSKGPPPPGASGGKGLSKARGPQGEPGAGKDDSGNCAAPEDTTPAPGDAAAEAKQEEVIAQSIAAPPEADAQSPAAPASAQEGKASQGEGKGKGKSKGPPPPGASGGKGGPGADNDGSEKCAAPDDTTPAPGDAAAEPEQEEVIAQPISAPPEADAQSPAAPASAQEGKASQGKGKGKGKSKGPSPPGASGGRGGPGADNDGSEKCAAPDDTTPAPGDAAAEPEQEQGIAQPIAAPPEADAQSPAAPMSTHGEKVGQGDGSAAAAVAAVRTGRRLTIAGANSSLAAAAAIVAAGSDEDGEAYSSQRLTEVGGSLPLQARMTCPPGQLLADPGCLQSADLDEVSEAKMCLSPTGEADSKNAAALSPANYDKVRKSKGRSKGPPPPWASGGKGLSKAPGPEGEPGAGKDDSGNCAAPNGTAPSTGDVATEAKQGAGAAPFEGGNEGKGKGESDGNNIGRGLPLQAQVMEDILECITPNSKRRSQSESSSAGVTTFCGLATSVSSSPSAPSRDPLRQSSTSERPPSQAGEVRQPYDTTPHPVEEASSNTCDQPGASGTDPCQMEASGSNVPRPLEMGTGGGCADEGGPTFFALDDEGDSDSDDGTPLKRQNSLDERYDAFEAMSRASLAGEIKRQSLNDVVAGAQAVQAFSLEADDHAEDGDDDDDDGDAPTGLRRSASFDWQYDALDAGNAIAAVAVAADASMPCDVSSPTFYCGGGGNLLAGGLADDLHPVPALPGEGREGPGDCNSQQARALDDAPSGGLTTAQGPTGTM